MLSDQKQEAIKLLAAKTHTVQSIADEVGVSRGTIYNWLKDDKFKAKLEEMNKYRDIYLRQHLKDHVEEYLKRLDKLGKSSKNDMVRLRANESMLSYAGWNSEQDINIKTGNGQDEANRLLELWQDKKKDKQQADE